MISLKEIIAKEAADNSEHDAAYRKALKDAYDYYSLMTADELRSIQPRVKSSYNGTHETVAACMVVYFLLEDAKNGTR